jgi:DNA-3-methyladenine glycosylase II
MKHNPAPPGCTAEIVVRDPPLDVAASVEMFRRWGDDLVDRWDGEVLLRTVGLDLKGEPVAVACRPTGTTQHPRLRIAVDDPTHLDAVQCTVADSFFATIPHATLRKLTDRDPIIRAADRILPGVRPVLQPDLLTALVRSISAQQINLRFATVVRARLAERYGRRHTVDGHTVYSLDPAAIAAASAADLRELQFTTRKAQSIIGVAGAVLRGSLDLTHLVTLSDEQVIAELVTLDGVGRWTAEWLLARTLGRPVVVAGDLGVRKAVGRAYRNGAMPTEQEVREITAHWGAAAGVAQQLLLHVLVEDRWDDLSRCAAAGP